MSVASEPKSTPLLFKGEMIRAIMTGRKTQTRRIIDLSEKKCLSLGQRKLGWKINTSRCFVDDFALTMAYLGGAKERPAVEQQINVPVGHPDDVAISWDRCGIERVWCPWGSPGDFIWCRETWARSINNWIYRADPANEDCRPSECVPEWDWGGNTRPDKWHPSIYMPKSACRIKLRLTEVRVQRLQEISEADARAEGFDFESTKTLLAGVARKAKTKYLRWVRDRDDNEQEEYYCPECASKEADKIGGSVDGWDEYFESDSVRICETCGIRLNTSLTEYGVENELGIGMKEIYPCDNPSDAETAHTLIDGIGCYEEKYEGKVCQAGFATMWQIINGKREGCRWHDNPWVWVLSFEVVK